MFVATQINHSVLKKVSIVESFYNPLDTPIRKAFKALWMLHFKQPEPSFYRRLKSPLIQDYALLIYFLGVKNEYSYLVDFYKSDYRDAETGEVYPTYNEIMLSSRTAQSL